MPLTFAMDSMSVCLSYAIDLIYLNNVLRLAIRCVCVCVCIECLAHSNQNMNPGQQTR